MFLFPGFGLLLLIMFVFLLGVLQGNFSLLANTNSRKRNKQNNQKPALCALSIVNTYTILQFAICLFFLPQD